MYLNYNFETKIAIQLYSCIHGRGQSADGTPRPLASWLVPDIQLLLPNHLSTTHQFTTAVAVVIINFDDYSYYIANIIQCLTLYSIVARTGDTRYTAVGTVHCDALRTAHWTPKPNNSTSVKTQTNIQCCYNQQEIGYIDCRDTRVVNSSRASLSNQLYTALLRTGDPRCSIRCTAAVVALLARLRALVHNSMLL